MNMHTATEQAYKNGYETGVKDLAKLLIDNERAGVIYIDDIPDRAIELIEKQRKEDEKNEQRRF